MTTQAKQEFEAVLSDILGQSDDALLRMIQEAGVEVYGKCPTPVFAPVVTTTQIVSAIAAPPMEAADFIYTTALMNFSSLPSFAICAKTEELALAA